MFLMTWPGSCLLEKGEKFSMEKSDVRKKKRGPYAKYPREVTMKRLLDAVGDILKENGWAGLGVNKIEARAGVSKKMIYHYFTTYNNLVKTYIKSIDFWMPVFEQFQNSDAILEQGLQEFITTIFQNQFKIFSSDPIMQTIIHWQVSEVNPLLREISEEREVEGARIAAMTDPHFLNSGLKFRPILALMLFGIYGIVWHAKTNKSTVCGVDINNESDREDLIVAIGQIIDLFWKAAEIKTLNQKEVITDS